MQNNIPKKRRGGKQSLIEGQGFTRKEGSYGDMRIVEDKRGVNLNIKHNYDWYKVKLERKDFMPFTFRNHTHHVADATTSAGTYHFCQLCRTETKAANTSLSNADLLMIPTDCKLEKLQFVSNVSIASTGTIGFKIYKYKVPGKGVSGTNLTSIGNYNLVETYESDDSISIGHTINIPLDINLKVGDIMLLAIRGKTTTSLTDVWLNLVFKEFRPELI